MHNLHSAWCPTIAALIITSRSNMPWTSRPFAC